MKFYKRTIVFAVVIGCLACLAFIFISDYNAQNALKLSESIKEKYRLDNDIEALLRNTLAMEAANRGYIITTDADVSAHYNNSHYKASMYLSRLDSFETADSTQAANLSRLEQLVKSRITMLEEVHHSDWTTDSTRMIELIVAGDDVMDEIRKFVKDIKTSEGRRLDEAEAEQLATSNRIRVITVVGGVLTILLVLAAFLLVRREMVQREKTNLSLQEAKKELERSDQRYGLLINTASDTICITDDKGLIQLWNSTGEQMWGYTAMEQLGRNIDTFIYGTKKDQPGEKVMLSDLSQENIDVYDWTVKGKSGKNTRVEIQSNSWEIDGKTFYGLNIRDISERLRNQEKLKTLLKDVQRSNEDLQQFAYVASHDLQEPLRKIRAFGDRLEQVAGETLTERAQQYVERMRDAAMRMQTLIQDLLQFSRVSRNSGDQQEVDLNETLNQVVADYHVSIQEADAKINFTSLPVLNQAISTQMYQLFQNLISNAIKFRKPEQAPEVSITCDSVRGKEVLDDVPNIHPRKKYHQITVTDNGIGFKQEYVDKIFTIFQRLHGRGEYAGTGIGLAVCRKICENHQGFLRAVGVEGEGASFIIYLPHKMNKKIEMPTEQA